MSGIWKPLAASFSVRLRLGNLLTIALVLPCGARPAAQAALFGELHRMLPADAEDTQTLALEDVDRDGDRDALFGGEGPYFGQPRLYLNDGSASRPRHRGSCLEWSARRGCSP